jgi:hypothetical protein
MIQPDDVKPYLNKDEKALLDLWYEGLLTSRVGIRPDEATGAVSDLRAMFGRWCDTSGVRRAVCEDWNYCQKHKEWGQKAVGIAGLADFIVTTCGLPSNGAIAVAVFLADHAADAICDCSGRDAAG